MIRPPWFAFILKVALSLSWQASVEADSTQSGTFAVVADHEAWLAEAVSGLKRQPMSDKQMGELIRKLQVLAEDPTGDETSIRARYFLGRLLQHSDQNTTEPQELQILLVESPQHPLAQLARIKLVLYRLYAPGTKSPAERLREAEALGQGLQLPSLQCDFHLAMGEAYLFFGDRREPALRHLRAAEQSGITTSATRGTVLVQIGELARLTGDRALASESYRAFLADFPRDVRGQIVHDRLTENEKESRP